MRRGQVAAVAAHAALLAAPLWAARSHADDNVRTVAAINGQAVYAAGPNAVEIEGRTSGRIATGVRNTAAGKTLDEMYNVSAPGGSRNANAAETMVLQKVANAVDALNGKNGAALDTARDALADAVKTVEPDKQGNFPNKPKPVASDASLFDGKGRLYVAASGTQMFDPANAKNVILGAAVNPAPKGSPAPQALPAGALTTGFVVNQDPLGVEWGPGLRAVTIDPSDLRLTLGSAPGGSAAAAAGLSLAFVDGATDPATPDDSASPLFALNFAASAVGGGPTDTSLSVSYTIDPSFDPAQYFISDTDGNTSLGAVMNDLMAQFALGRTDPATGDTYYGFDPGYAVTVGVPGLSADELLVLDEFAGTSAAVPEPASAALMGVALLVAGISAVVRPFSRGRASATVTAPAEDQAGIMLMTTPRLPL